jgi:hypothetical protein
VKAHDTPWSSNGCAHRLQDERSHLESHERENAFRGHISGRAIRGIFFAGNVGYAVSSGTPYNPFGAFGSTLAGTGAGIASGGAVSDVL